MSRRLSWIAAALLLAVAAAVAWNAIRLQHAGRPAQATVPDADISAVSLDAYPGTVADAARVMKYFRRKLELMSGAWREDLGVDVHVVTIATAELPAEQLAPELFALRRVGAGAPTGGILVLLNPARAEARIEVSYELESVLTDALCGSLAEGQLAPYTAEQYAGWAMMDIVGYLRDIVIEQAIAGRIDLAESFRARPGYQARLRHRSGGGGAQARVPSPEEIAARDFKARVEDERRARYAPSKDPSESAEAFLRVQRDLVGDPTLELLTEGSQCLRRRNPFAPYEEIERARRLDSGKPWRVTVSGDRAVVDAVTRPHGFFPLLLQRVDGLWRVDIVEVGKNLFFDDNGDYLQHNSDNPYRFGLHGYGPGQDFGVMALDLGGASIEDTIAALEAKRTPLAAYLLGEVLERNCNLPMLAMAEYERASESAPGAYLFHETLARRASYHGFAELALEAYGRIPDLSWFEISRHQEVLGDLAGAAESARRALARDPRDTQVLRALQRYLEASNDRAGAREAAEELAALDRDRARGVPIRVHFDPPAPLLELAAPARVGSAALFDHATFRTTLENPGNRAVVLEQVRVIAAATEATPLGDLKDAWTYPSGGHRLAPGEAVTLARTWGFETDTQNEQVRYVFDVCWHGDGEQTQCRATSLDVFPR